MTVSLIISMTLILNSITETPSKRLKLLAMIPFILKVDLSKLRSTLNGHKKEWVTKMVLLLLKD